MINVVARAGNLSNLMRKVVPALNSNIMPPPKAVPNEKPYPMPLQQVYATAFTAVCAVPKGRLVVVSGPSVKQSVRFGHTDAKVPDFDYYRRKGTRNPNLNDKDERDNQRFYTSLVCVAGGAGSFFLAKKTVNFFIGILSPTAAVMALSKIEVKKSDIPEGKNVTFKWRGKPLFVRHRTPEEITKEREVPMSALRDPQPDSARAKDPEWLIVIGVCTHLGCVPIAYQGDWGGYYCPCHGSHYDTAGRIRKGPAPTNLEVPPYEFVDDTIVVG